MKTHELDTPALLVDLNNMESNLARMASFLRQTPAKLRPHFKNHRIVSLAKRQLEAGAIGMTCARLSQAEVLIQNGIRSVLIANEIVGEAPIKRFLELSQQADLIAPVDNETVVADMARLAGNRKTQASVLVDLDVGLKRCGVPTMEAALRLARVVAEKGLRLRGVMAYEGHLQPIAPGPEKGARGQVSHAVLDRCKELDAA